MGVSTKEVEISFRLVTLCSLQSPIHVQRSVEKLFYFPRDWMIEVKQINASEFVFYQSLISSFLAIY